MRINQWGQDNSFATVHPKNELRFGKGGVDDAEDAEVILHEYGHAIHFSQNFSFASEEAGAISEGFGDYWAVTVSDVVARSLGVANREPLPCVADWDSTSYTSGRPALPACLSLFVMNHPSHYNVSTTSVKLKQVHHARGLAVINGVGSATTAAVAFAAFLFAVASFADEVKLPARR